MTTATSQPVGFLYADISGLVRGRFFPERDLERRLRSGVGWVPANQALTAFGPIAEPNPWGALGDLRLVPDPSTETRVDLWDDPAPLHFFLCDAMEIDGTPWECCPRCLLKKALAALEAEFGAQMIAAFEQEFQLRLPSSPVQPPPGFSLEAARANEPFPSLLLEAFEQANIEAEALIPEYGTDQFEFSTAPTAGLRAADEAVIAREVTREVARRLGGRTVFAPLVADDQPGNGLHIHFSFRSPDGQPLTYDPQGPAGLSQLAYHFASGILAHLPAICAVTAPTAISYERLMPNRWSAGYPVIGLQNREAAIRIPPLVRGETPEGDQFNLEFRAADNASSTHFALAVLVLAGVDGIRHSLEAPILGGDQSQLTAQEPEQQQTALPGSLEQALDALAADPLFATSISADLLSTYESVKRAELRMLAQSSPSDVMDRYGDVY